jgi:hypothetical protein
MMMNQIPSSTARTVTDVTGDAVTTIPAIRLTSPYTAHQPRIRPTPANAPMSAATPCTIQVIPISRPIAAMVRSRWRISTTPTTTRSRPEIACQVRFVSALSNALIR